MTKSRSQSFYNSAFAASQPGSGSGGNLTTPGDYQLLPGGLAGGLVSGNSQAFAVAQVVRVLEFHVDTGITFTRISITITTTANGSHEVIGLYTLSGNLIQQYVFTMGAGTGVLTLTGQSPVTLAEGISYYLARATDQTTSTLQGFVLQANSQSMLNVGGVNPRLATAANLMVGTNLPTTLGVLTATTNNNPIVLVEP